MLKVIGNGAFGVVLEALDTKNNRKVAIKRTLKMGQRVSREYEVLKRLQGCPNVVQLLDFFYSYDQLKRLVQNTVMEYCDFSLEQKITQMNLKPMPMAQVKSVVR